MFRQKRTANTVSPFRVAEFDESEFVCEKVSLRDDYGDGDVRKVRRMLAAHSVERVDEVDRRLKREVRALRWIKE